MAAARRVQTAAVLAAGLFLSGCGFLFPELDYPIDVLEQRQVGPVLVETRIDGTERYGGEQGIHCAGGRYAGGGNEDNVKRTKDGLERHVDGLKDKIKDTDKQSERCKGKFSPQSEYDGRNGCDRQRMSALYASAAPTNSPSASYNDYVDMSGKCIAADRAADQDPCSEYVESVRKLKRNSWANDLQDAQRRQVRFQECNKDRERQAGVTQQPTVTPGMVLTPGMLAPRQPSRRQEPTHSTQPSRPSTTQPSSTCCKGH
jgi:hypothetical protein